MLKIAKHILLGMTLCLCVAGQEPRWEIVGEMPVPVYGGQAVATDSLIYIFGGYSDSVYAPVNYIQTYDPKNDRWELLEDTLLMPRFGCVAAVYQGDLILMGGVTSEGQQMISMEKWDFEGPPVVLDTSVYFNRSFATGVIIDHIFYVFGGYPDYRLWSDTLTIPYIYGYDLSTQEVVYRNTELYSDISVDGSPPYQQMSIQFGDYIYVFGGAHNGILIEVYRFSLMDESWVPVFPALFEERAAGAVVRATEEMVMVIGGYNESYDAMALTEYYYPDAHYSEQGPDMHAARKELMAVLFEGNIYVFGGRDPGGEVVRLVERISVGGTTGIGIRTPVSPGHFRLLSNYPNPFNPQTHITLDNPGRQHMRVEIYDITGCLIKTLYKDILPPGVFEFTWAGTDESGTPQASGIYICRASNGEMTQSRRMILIR
jgi:hypothetical protein